MLGWGCIHHLRAEGTLHGVLERADGLQGLGIAVGAAACALINAAHIHVPRSVQLFLMRDTLTLALEAPSVGWASLLITCVSGAAALFPALRAASRKPVDAMAHFG